jgi:hypothetical protein
MVEHNITTVAIVSTSTTQTTTETSPKMVEHNVTTSTTQTTTETSPKMVEHNITTTQATTSLETSPTPQRIIPSKPTSANPQFVATDTRETETMFPKSGDYDDDTPEGERLMKSLMQLMDMQKERKALEKKLDEMIQRYNFL